MALITLDQAKDFLQITVTTTDSLLTDYINMVSAEVEAYCDRRFDTVTYTEVLHIGRSDYDLDSRTPLNMGENRPTFRLRQTPVQDFTTLVSDTTTITSSNYTVDTKNGLVTLYTAVTDYKDELVATYVAGYTTTTGSDFTVPYELQLVAKQGVRDLYQNNQAAKQGAGNVSSKKIKDFSVSYGSESNTGMYTTTANGEIMKTYLAGNKSILDRYKFIGI